ncbi:hypothetical protein Tco_1201432 [Tanacetum coccineum]
MSRPTRLKRLKKVSMSKRVESSKDQESLGTPEDASKQGRSIEDIDVDVDLMEKMNIEEITLAQTLIQIKEVKPKVVTTAATTTTTTRPKDRGVVIQEPSSEVQESKEKKEKGREETAKGSRKKMLGRKRAGKEQ